MTWMGESDVILTCDKPTGEASECSNVLEGEVQDSPGIKGEQDRTSLGGSERLHGGADEAQGKGGPGRGCCVSKAFGEILMQWGQRGIEDSEMISCTVGCERPVGQPEELGLAAVESKRRVSCRGVPRPGCGRERATLS